MVTEGVQKRIQKVGAKDQGKKEQRASTKTK